MLGASRDVEDAGGRLKKLSAPSERERECSEQKVEEDSPGEARDKPDEADGDADALGASKGNEDPENRPKELRNGLERIRERIEQGKEKNSPRSALDELGSETAVPGDNHV